MENYNFDSCNFRNVVNKLRINFECLTYMIFIYFLRKNELRNKIFNQLNK
jgi:hypothetical protein